jgi:hypothetical protein
MLQRWNIAQYTLSRFLTASYDWAAFGRKRVSRLQQDEHKRLKDGDVVNLDDTVIDHPYGKKLPFLCWLFDSSQKIHVWGEHCCSPSRIAQRIVVSIILYGMEKTRK